MNISDEAVEAAKVAFGGKLPMGFRLALAAAAPYLMAEAWAEGAEAQATRYLMQMDAGPNPYRDQP